LKSLLKWSESVIENDGYDALNEKHPLGHELDQQVDKNPEGFTGFVHELGTWAKEHPGAILKTLNKLRPVLTIKDVSVVTSYEAVKDVLGRDGDFGVNYGPKMEKITEGKGFFLGMDDNTDGFSARNNMQMLFRRDDIDTIVKPIIKGLCADQLKGLNDQFDLVDDYLKLIPAKFAIQYFGLKDTDPQWLLKTTQTLFEYIFIDVVNDPDLDARAQQAAKELRDQLDKMIASSSTSEDANTVIARGIKLDLVGVAGFNSVNLRNNILGLLIGLVPTTAKSAAMAFDYGTKTPAKENELYAAYKNSSNNSFQKTVRELSRLNPINPGLFRRANFNTQISSGGNQYQIKKDTLIFVGTYTAMQDSAHVRDPSSIKTDRPESDYLTYGFGLHACFGRYINDFHVGQLLESLFDKNHYVREENDSGNLIFDGAFPVSLKVKLLP